MARATGYRRHQRERRDGSRREGLPRLAAGASYLGIPERTLARALASGSGVRALTVPRHRSPEVLRAILEGPVET